MTVDPGFSSAASRGAVRPKKPPADAANLLACRSRTSAAIGMTERQAYDSRWGEPYAVNTTTVAAGERVQWVYKWGPMCKDDGTPNHDGNRGYLYFDDGILTGIQQRGD